MKRLFTALAAAAAITLANLAATGATAPVAAVVTDPSTVPVVIDPIEGEFLDYYGMNRVSIDFSPVVNAENYRVSVVRSGGCSQTPDGPQCAAYATVPVSDATGIVTVTLDGVIDVGGDYQITVAAVSGGYAAYRNFTLRGTFPGPEAPDPVQILSPSDGATLLEGFTGPVRISFPPTSDVTTYDIRLQNNEGYWWLKQYATTGGTASFTVPALPRSDYYELAVFSPVKMLTSIGFYVQDAPEPMTISRVSISPGPFFPLVRDGFRDTTRLSYVLGMDARVVADVYNSAGRRIRSVTIGRKYQGADSWAWNGRRNDGTLAPVGTYRVAVTATNADGMSKTVQQSVQLTTDTVTRRGSISKNGTSTYATNRTSSCYVTRYAPELQLDCWGGRYANATYRLPLPANAYNVAFSVSGYQGCCDDGRITRTGTRLNSTTQQVRVQVTGWRSYTVRSVSATYSYKVRR